MRTSTKIGKELIEVTEGERQYNIKPFGPSIMKDNMPQEYVNLINAQVDAAFHDKKIRKERDWSFYPAENLKSDLPEGLVDYEGMTEPWKAEMMMLKLEPDSRQAIIHDKIPGLTDFLVSMCDKYIKRARPGKPCDKSKMDFSVWAYCSYAGDYNPNHNHGDGGEGLSGVAFLRLPPKYEEEYKKDMPALAPGCLEFSGSVPNAYTEHTYLVTPVVGDIYLFPSWLPHQVYPFKSEGERRSMAFNVSFKEDG